MIWLKYPENSPVDGEKVLATGWQNQDPWTRQRWYVYAEYGTAPGDKPGAGYFNEDEGEFLYTPTHFMRIEAPE